MAESGQGPEQSQGKTDQPLIREDANSFLERVSASEPHIDPEIDDLMREEPSGELSDLHKSKMGNSPGRRTHLHGSDSAIVVDAKYHGTIKD